MSTSYVIITGRDAMVRAASAKMARRMPYGYRSHQGIVIGAREGRAIVAFHATTPAQAASIAHGAAMQYVNGHGVSVHPTSSLMGVMA